MNTELMKAVERATPMCGKDTPDWVEIDESDWDTILAALRDLEADNARLRGSHKHLHRRCQMAESALPDYRKLIALPPDGDGARFVNGSLGRVLLSVTCDTLANERDALQSGLAKQVDRVCELQSRLAAANALLRECRRLAAHFFKQADPGDLYERIDAHLQGAGNREAAES